MANDNLNIPNDEDLMLTTIDNPFNPKEEYDRWRRWDVDNGYNTEEYLSRVTDIPDDVDLEDEVTINLLTTKAIYEILENDMLQVYVLV